MPLTLSPVTEDDNIDKLCAMEYEGWQTPHNPQLRHFRPAHNTPEEWIAYSKEKKLKSLASKNPKVFSLKVTDTDNGDMVGFAAWGINDNPEAAERTEAVWHPEGSVEREFAERFINGLWEYLGKRVTRPHMGRWTCVFPHCIGANSGVTRSLCPRCAPEASKARGRKNAYSLGH